ncbi:MAG: aspartyl/asparaginyl beta-hydroxylase domain-containing protein [Elainellaceae cyanobacterium]
MKSISGFTVKQLEKVVPYIERAVPAYSKVGESVFFSKEQFPWATHLEAHWTTIRKELDSVLERVDELPNFQDISKRQYRIANDNRWKTYFFWAFGFRAEGNCQRCPETTALLEKIPGLKVAFFSILAPGKHIPRHRGKHKGLIRYHLGLKVPEPADQCYIQVDDQVARWQEGKSLIFDDTYYHEVWNNTEGYRAVLFLDIVRPMRFPLSLVNWLVCRLVAASPIVQDARKSHDAWEKKFEATAQRERVTES